MGKIRYICTTCTNGFTTLSAARRHLNNVEKGVGMAVTEADYRLGIATGTFSSAPRGKHPEYKKPLDLMAVAGEEYHRGFWRRFGELDCENMFSDKEKREQLRNLIQIYRMKEMLKLFSG